MIKATGMTGEASSLSWRPTVHSISFKAYYHHLKCSRISDLLRVLYVNPRRLICVDKINVRRHARITAKTVFRVNFSANGLLSR